MEYCITNKKLIYIAFSAQTENIHQENRLQQKLNNSHHGVTLLKLYAVMTKNK